MNHLLVLVGLAGILATQLPGCSNNKAGDASPGAVGGVTSKAGQTGSGGFATGGIMGTGGVSATDGPSATSDTHAQGGGSSTGVTKASGGATTSAPASGGVTGFGGATISDAGGTPPTDKYVVSLVQSSKANATDLTSDDVAALVSSAVTEAGGLDFIAEGKTVVLKPNLVTAYTDHYRMTPADKTVNGIATDWRVVKAVADLVRARVGSTGKILVMEGSTMSTATAYSMLGYTKANISAVDEFIAIEGSSCSDRSANGLVQKPGKSGTQYWVNKRYFEADVVISIPTMKTHSSAGITGAVKNLGIGITPISQFSGDAGAINDCTRAKGPGTNSIDHSTPEALGAFIRDYYSVRPADFVVMDGLQGVQHGPSPAFDLKPGGDAGYWEYDASKMNMRLIVAGKNAVAVDTVEALVMKCNPKKVPHLTLLEADGLGTTDISKIAVVGEQIADVAKAFACKQTEICPGN